MEAGEELGMESDGSGGMRREGAVENGRFGSGFGSLHDSAEKRNVRTIARTKT
jgi:hypothetical protein